MTPALARSDEQQTDTEVGLDDVCWTGIDLHDTRMTMYTFFQRDGSRIDVPHTYCPTPELFALQKNSLERHGYRPDIGVALRPTSSDERGITIDIATRVRDLTKLGCQVVSIDNCTINDPEMIPGEALLFCRP